MRHADNYLLRRDHDWNQNFSTTNIDARTANLEATPTSHVLTQVEHLNA